MKNDFACQAWLPTLVDIACMYYAVWNSGYISYSKTIVNSLSVPIGSVHAVCVESEGFIVAHQVVVVMWDGEQVWVYQKPQVVGVESGEHLADGWNPHLPLVEHALFLNEEDAVCDGSVDVSVWVVVQADHIALGDDVEEDRGEEGEEANDSTESSLHGETLDSYSGLQEYVGH